MGKAIVMQIPITITPRKNKSELVAIAECNHCGSKLEIEKSECTKKWDDGRPFLQTDEKCPVCQKQHLFLFESDFRHKKS